MRECIVFKFRSSKYDRIPIDRAFSSRVLYRMWCCVSIRRNCILNSCINISNSPFLFDYKLFSFEIFYISFNCLKKKHVQPNNERTFLWISIILVNYGWLFRIILLTLMVWCCCLNSLLINISTGFSFNWKKSMKKSMNEVGSRSFVRFRNTKICNLYWLEIVCINNSNLFCYFAKIIYY